MSNLEHNKQTAISMIQQLATKGFLDDSLLTEDVYWWIPGRGKVSKAEFLGLAGEFRRLTRGDVRMEILGITAEGDRVAVEAESFAPLANGATYNNTYHFLFEFSGGKIRCAKEYNDTRYATKTLGALAKQ